MKSLYESLLDKTNKKIGSAKDFIIIENEFKLIDKLKWKIVGKDGPVTKYECEWECPNILKEAYLDNKVGQPTSIVFHLNATKGNTIFGVKNSAKGFFYIEILTQQGRTCGYAAFFEFSAMGGIKILQRDVLNFVKVWGKDLETMTKGCYSMFKKHSGKLFMQQIVKEITGKNHWEL